MVRPLKEAKPTWAAVTCFWNSLECVLADNNIATHQYYVCLVNVHRQTSEKVIALVPRWHMSLRAGIMSQTHLWVIVLQPIPCSKQPSSWGMNWVNGGASRRQSLPEQELVLHLKLSKTFPPLNERDVIGGLVRKPQCLLPLSCVFPLTEGSTVSEGGCVMGHCGQNRCKRRGNGNYWVLPSNRSYCLIWEIRLHTISQKTIIGRSQTIDLCLSGPYFHPIDNMQWGVWRHFPFLKCFLKSVCCRKSIHQWLCY